MECNNINEENGKVDFEFCYDENNNPIVKTTPPFYQPKSIYKFFNLSSSCEYHFTALEQNYLYASHSYELNDPLDSSDKIIDFSNVNKSFFEKYYKRYLRDKYNQEEVDEEFFADQKRNFTDFGDVYISSLSNRYGSISFARNFTSVLMWSHYSTHRGFCIEFDKNILINEYKDYNSDINHLVFRPMIYLNPIKLFDFKKLILEGDGKLIPLIISSIKSEVWKYEEEYRITIFKKDMSIPFNSRGNNFNYYDGKESRNLKYNPKAINKIILGGNFFQNKYLSEQNNSLKVIFDWEKKCDRKNSKLYYKFIKLIVEKYSDKIYIVKQQPIDGILKLIRQKILIKLLCNDSFELIETNEIFIFD